MEEYKLFHFLGFCVQCTLLVTVLCCHRLFENAVGPHDQIGSFPPLIWVSLCNHCSFILTDCQTVNCTPRDPQCHSHGKVGMETIHSSQTSLVLNRDHLHFPSSYLQLHTRAPSDFHHEKLHLPDSSLIYPLPFLRPPPHPAIKITSKNVPLQRNPPTTLRNKSSRYRQLLRHKATGDPASSQLSVGIIETGFNDGEGPYIVDASGFWGH